MTTLALGSIQVRPLPLNWRRISALSGSLSAHIALVLLLLIPPVALELNRVVQRHDDMPIIVTLPEQQVVKDIPLPTPPQHIIRKVEVKHPTPVISIEKPTAVPIDVPTESALPTDAGDHTAAPPSSGKADIGGDSAPTAMGYGNLTKIPYPIIALRNHEQGTVTLRVLVGVDGKPQKVEIDRTSGSHALDIAARDAVRHWTFRPGIRNGIAYAAWAVVPVSFSFPQ
jgi:protein TonB